jgi:hypothetical protein
MTASARFVAVVLGTAATLLAATAAFNAWCDPFLQYGPPRFAPRFVSGFARHINAGLARNSSYDTVLVGSSYAMNFRNSDFDRQFGGHTISLAMPGMFVSEGAKVVAFAQLQRPLKHVFFDLDFFAFVERDNKYDFPDYLYDASWINDGAYLLSLDTLKRSAYAMSGRGPANFNTDPDAPWNWAAHGARFGRAEVLADYGRKRATPRASPSRYELQEMKEVARRQLEPLLVRYPQTEFDFFLPPYSALSWALDDERGDLRTLLAFREFLGNLLAPYRNARLHDFQAMRTLACDLDHYTDIGHFRPEDNAAMVVMMKEGSHVATPPVLRANNDVIAKMVQSHCDGTLGAAQ